MSIPIENVRCLGHYTDIFFPYRRPLLHSAFSMSKGIVTMDTTCATHVHMMINLLFPANRKYLST